jgi:hypothetical protein
MLKASKHEAYSKMNYPYRAVEDYHVDRSGVYARIYEGAELTDPNRPIGLIVMRVCSAMVELPELQRKLMFFEHLTIPGDHTGRVTPVPIPNTDVKPARADDSRKAKVGRCLDFSSAPRTHVRGALF